MKASCHNPRSARGFTLLEVLLAVVVFAILLGAINSVLYSGLHVRNITTDALERQAPLERTLAVIKHDLANIVLPGGIMSGTLQTTPLANNLQPDGTTGPIGPQLDAMLNQVSVGVPGQSSPLFYVANGIVDETSPWADIEQIYYYLATPTNSATPGMDLYRSMTCNLLPLLAEVPINQYLMSGVQSINFYFYGTGATQIGQWQDTWDSTNPDLLTSQTNNVPRAIKVEIQLVSRGSGMGSPVELVVPVWVQADTNMSSSVTGTLSAQAGGTP